LKIGEKVNKYCFFNGLMEEYYFLIFLAGLWALFASVSDFKTREVPNWISFSLIAFALAYRAFYSIGHGWMFLVYGLLGLGIFIVLGYLFYYGRAFGGGDAKLLMASGAILPFESYMDYLFVGMGFIFILFLAGGIYSLVYTVFLIRRNKKFSKEFKGRIKKNKLMVFGLLIVGLALAGVFVSTSLGLSLAFLFLGLMPLLYFYALSVDKCCMIILKKPRNLQEGDWIMKDIKVGRKMVKKTVHGLTKKDILILRRSGRNVEIRDGVPFTISFLLAIMLFFSLFFLYPGLFSF